MDKPLLYLDVDGVLNPVHPRPDAGFTAHTLLGARVLLSARHGSWLRELADVYELAWATTWQQYANRFIGPLLGLPELPVVPLTAAEPTGTRRGPPPEPKDRTPPGDWLPILRHAAGRPFAWLDDLIPIGLLRACAGREDRLLLPVDPAEGLRRADVERLLRRPPRAAGRPPGGWTPRSPFDPLSPLRRG